LCDVLLILQIIAVASAAASAISAFLILRGNRLTRMAIEQWSKTLVQPRIFVHGSTRAARQRIGTGEGRLATNQIDIPRIFVENIGFGPAVRGIVYVIDHQGNKIPIRGPNENYTFLRIPQGSVYHYPSNDSPELEPHIRGQTRIRIQVQYFDIKDNEYWLPSTEEIVDLFV